MSTKLKMVLSTIGCMLPALPFVGKLSATAWVAGLLISLVYANLFEYGFHKLYHNPKSPFFRNHMDHHIHDTDPEHVNLFGGSVRGIVGLFAANILPFMWTKLWVPVLIGFGAYLLLTEEIHHRVHLGGWVPDAFRRHHLAHHEYPPRNYNVWLPLGDRLFGG